MGSSQSVAIRAAKRPDVVEPLAVLGERGKHPGGDELSHVEGRLHELWWKLWVVPKLKQKTWRDQKKKGRST